MTPAEETYVAHCLAVRQDREREVKALLAEDWARQRAAHPLYTITDHTVGQGGDR